MAEATSPAPAPRCRSRAHVKVFLPETAERPSQAPSAAPSSSGTTKRDFPLPWLRLPPHQPSTAPVHTRTCTSEEVQAPSCCLGLPLPEPSNLRDPQRVWALREPELEVL